MYNLHEYGQIPAIFIELLMIKNNKKIPVHDVTNLSCRPYYMYGVFSLILICVNTSNAIYNMCDCIMFYCNSCQTTNALINVVFVLRCTYDCITLFIGTLNILTLEKQLNVVNFGNI
jgi:hypothetical protein